MVERVLGMLVALRSVINTAEKQQQQKNHREPISDSAIYDLISTEGWDTSGLLRLKTGQWGGHAGTSAGDSQQPLGKNIN